MMTKEKSEKWLLHPKWPLHNWSIWGGWQFCDGKTEPQVQLSYCPPPNFTTPSNSHPDYHHPSIIILSYHHIPISSNAIIISPHILSPPLKDDCINVIKIIFILWYALKASHGMVLTSSNSFLNVSRHWIEEENRIVVNEAQLFPGFRQIRNETKIHPTACQDGNEGRRGNPSLPTS